MKKSILLLSAGLIAGFAHAQSSRNSVMFNANPAGSTVATENGVASSSFPSTNYTEPAANHFSGAKTTSGPGGKRWYNYVDFLMQPYLATIGKDVSYYSYMLWNDTSAKIGYTGGTGSPYSYNNLISAGLGFDPTYTSTAVPGLGWNESGTGAISDFTGSIGVSSADAYTIDSVFVPGWYTRTYATPVKTAVVDTLILAFVTSNRSGSGVDLPGASLASPPACYGVITLPYQELYHDITNNRAAHNGGTPVTKVYKYVLNSQDTNSSSNNIGNQFPRTVAWHSTDSAISVPVLANQIAAMTVTYKSGDAAYPVFPGQDTIRYSNGTSITGYKYNNWQLQGNYAVTTTGGTTADCTLYDPNNMGHGYWGFEGRGFPYHPSKYYVNWNIIGVTATGTVPSQAQFPRIAYHIVCPTCNIVGNPLLGVEKVTDLKNVTVTPNPANEVVGIAFTAAQGANATVSLTNMLGQVVASQVVTTGNASFNTANLAAGVYAYSVVVNGTRSTGRVVVAH